MFLINNRIISENHKIKSSILKNSINYIRYHRAISENDVIKFKCLSRIIMFKNDIFITNAFLNFYYDEHIY